MKLVDIVKSEATAILNDVARHILYAFSGKKSKRWNGKGKERNAVLLLHGYFQGDAAFSHNGLEDFLYENGFRVDKESYEFWKDLRDVEEDVSNRVERIYKRTKRKVDIIGHSEGGLVARAVAQKNPDLIEKVITLGAPHHGTYTAIVGNFFPFFRKLTKSARQMCPWSDYIKELNNRELPKSVKFYSIYSKYDFLIVPKRSAILTNGSRDHIYNIEIKNTGHVGLIERQIYPLILDILLGKFNGEKRSVYNTQ